MQAEEAESWEPGVGGILRARRVVMDWEMINADDICERSLIARIKKELGNHLTCLYHHLHTIYACRLRISEIDPGIYRRRNKMLYNINNEECRRVNMPIQWTSNGF